jgi:hypothetical protein
MFAQDRNLLLLAPSLFRDVAWLSQTLHRGTLNIASGQLITATGTFAAAIQPGHIAVLDERPLEITAITSPTSLTVSLIRADPAEPIIPPADSSNAPGAIATFAPQIGLIHDQLLRMLDLEPAQQAIDPLAPTEASILNPRDLALVESLGALHLIYATASATLTHDTALVQRAAYFHDRFTKERWRARALLDLNNDGRADTTRALRTLHLTRH